MPEISVAMWIRMDGEVGKHALYFEYLYVFSFTQFINGA